MSRTSSVFALQTRSRSSCPNPSDAKAAGGDNYAALCSLSLRQAFGGTELVGTQDKPWLMLKEISSDGNVSTVDVVFPASPAFLYTSPLLLKLMLDPLLELCGNRRLAEAVRRA